MGGLQEAKLVVDTVPALKCSPFTRIEVRQ